MQLRDMLVFNVLCCNTDAHMKNHSLMLSALCARLAPLYDVMCAPVWPNIARNLALDIGGRRDGTYIEGRHWAREAEACGLAPRRAVARVDQWASRVRAELASTAHDITSMPAGPHGVVNEVIDAIDARCRAIPGTLAK